MSTHHHPPTPQDPMPLDAEERALAARIARLGPHGEPSPALDARVLAAAHAAATHDARAASRGGRARRGESGWRRARWPVGVGLAASVALAAGIAWQMRPLPAPVFAPDAAVSGEAAMTSPAAEQGDAFAARVATSPAARVHAPLEAATAEVSTAPQSRDAAAAGAAAPQSAAVAVAAKAMAPPAAEPPVVFDAPAPVAAVDAVAPPPAPPAPPLSESDAPADDVPPATAASPEVRDAWLARIREIAAAGHTDDARASLAEFRRRYPAFAVPEDLRPLLPPATPATQPVAPPR